MKTNEYQDYSKKGSPSTHLHPISSLLRHSPFGIRYSLFPVRYSLFGIIYSLFGIRYSLFGIRTSLFAFPYSLFAIRYSLFFLILSLITSCRQDESWEAEAQALLERAHDLDARHEAIDARIDSLWDATSKRLEAYLPPDFPAVDRDIFLNARNADHIQMFMSFNYLDVRAQQLVYAAGEADHLLSEEIRLLSEERRQFESDKMDFLKRLSQSDESASALYADKLRMAPQ